MDLTKYLSFNRILYFLFPISIIVDFTNGFFQLKMGIHLPIGVLYRGFVLIILLCSLLKLKDKVWVIYLILLLTLFAISFEYWIMKNPIKVSVEIDNFIRIVYFLLMILFFKVNSHKIDSVTILNLITNYGFMIGCCIIFSFITGFGHHSYGENYGFGTKSFFKAGNDLGMTLLYSSVFASMNLFGKMSFTNLFKFISIVLACSLIGSRVGMIGAIIVLGISFLYYVFYYNPISKKMKRIKYFSIITIIPFLCYSLYFIALTMYASFDDYTLKRLSLDSILSARDVLIDSAKDYINGLEGFSSIVGEGAYMLFQKMASIMNLGIESGGKTVEADYYELIGSYGYLFGGLILFPFLYYALRSLIVFYNLKSIQSFWAVFIFCSFLYLGFSAGHAIKNTMVPPIYACSIVVLLQRKDRLLC